MTRPGLGACGGLTRRTRVDAAASSTAALRSTWVGPIRACGDTLLRGWTYDRRSDLGDCCRGNLYRGAAHRGAQSASQRCGPLQARTGDEGHGRTTRVTRTRLVRTRLTPCGQRGTGSVPFRCGGGAHERRQCWGIDEAVDGLGPTLCARLAPDGANRVRRTRLVPRGRAPRFVADARPPRSQ